MKNCPLKFGPIWLPIFKGNVEYGTGKERKIFLEDSHFVWFSTESRPTFYLHYNVGRIHLSGTE